MVQLGTSAVIGEEDRAVLVGVGDELPPGSRDQSAGGILQGAPDRIASGLYVPPVRDEDVTGEWVEARIELREDLNGGFLPNPATFTPCCRDPYQPVNPLKHPRLPQGVVPSQVAAFADQPIGVANILHSQQIRFAHLRSPV